VALQYNNAPRTRLLTHFFLSGTEHLLKIRPTSWNCSAPHCSRLVHVDITPGCTYTGGSSQSTGGDCTPAAPSAEQRDTDKRGEGTRCRPYRLGRSTES
jgi:hypothetical protein